MLGTRVQIYWGCAKKERRHFQDENGNNMSIHMLFMTQFYHSRFGYFASSLSLLTFLLYFLVALPWDG